MIAILKSILVSVLLSALLFSCKKEYSYESKLRNAIITGFDKRKCACCGGLVINFEGNTQSSQGMEYLIDNNSFEFGIDPVTASFPIACRVEWVPVDRCVDGFIRITKFKR